MTLTGRAVLRLRGVNDSTLLRELDDNLCCLRLNACEPCNGIAQSDMHIAPTTPVETKSPPYYIGVWCYNVDSQSKHSYT